MPASASARSPRPHGPGMGVQPALLRQGHDVLRLGRREREDPAVAREPQLAPLAPPSRREWRPPGSRSTGCVPLRVRERQHGVPRRRVANRLRAHRLAPPGMRVPGRHLAEAAVERAIRSRCRSTSRPSAWRSADSMIAKSSTGEASPARASRSEAQGSDDVWCTSGGGVSGGLLGVGDGLPGDRRRAGRGTSPRLR